MDSENVVHVPAIGQPEIDPLSDYSLKMIVSGLLIPNQGAGKAMARELMELREKVVSLKKQLDAANLGWV